MTQIRPINEAQNNVIPSPGSTDWVLVVDDEEPLRKLVGQFLAEQDLTVVGAESAETALQILAERSTEPLVVLIDVLMPGMDGLTLTRKLQSRLKRSTLVIISGHLNDLSWWPVDLREVAFLSKPFRLADITEIVTAARAAGVRE